MNDMRKFLLCGTAALALSAGTALAGGLAEPAMDPEVVAATTSSSSAGIVVPLLLLLLIAAAASGGNGGGEQVSDRRVKTDIAWMGMRDGQAVYRYRYRGSDAVFEGVMAQDVRLTRPDAVVERANGLLAVDYGRLGLSLRRVA
jgi:hypothetical protein